MLASSARRGDVWAGLFLAALGAYIATQSLTWQVLGPSGPGPGFFPLIYGTLMIALSLALVARATFGRAEPAPTGGEPVDWEGRKAALILWLLFVAAVFAMRYVGFLVAFALLFFLVTRIVFSRPLWHSAAAAVAGPALFYLVFALGLQVRLPLGTLTGF
jgi:putative tricarboxylic transport membrane protein